MEEELIGRVSHWYGKISVIGVTLTGRLAVGDDIHVRGHTTDFEQKVTSLQIWHQDVTEAKAGDEVGIKVAHRARAGDRVYKVTQSE
ncbi:MAG TPA: translation elongation factor-like protein [Chloroflexi bacterium]|nr:translation elongation factor-like protein [Chloroflexota bacterium]